MNSEKEIRDALNKANVCMQNYFKDALALSPGADALEIEESKKAAMEAIKEFLDKKREYHEMKLTPYEEKCLGTMDAANQIVMSKTCPHHHHHEGGPHHDC